MARSGSTPRMPVSLSRFNPFRHTGAPMILSAMVGIACVAGGRYVWPIAFLSGIALCVVGARIAYNHRGAAGYLRWRRLMPGWGTGTSIEVHRQIEGGVVFIFGAFFTVLAVTGIIELVK